MQEIAQWIHQLLQNQANLTIYQTLNTIYQTLNTIHQKPKTKHQLPYTNEPNNQYKQRNSHN